MNILAMDTSADVLSLALCSPLGTQCIDIEGGSRHSELLMDWVDRILKSVLLEPEDLDLLACMKGPGSFTGLRIGFSVAKGLSLALGIPMIAVSTLDCMAYSLSIWPGLVLPVLDAKKGCFFTALYRAGKRLSDYLDIAPEALVSTLDTYKLNKEENVLVTGPGSELCISQLKALHSENSILVDPLFFRGRSLELLHIVKNTDTIDSYEGPYSAPLYIRRSDAEINRA